MTRIAIVTAATQAALRARAAAQNINLLAERDFSELATYNDPIGGASGSVWKNSAGWVGLGTRG
jgi:hypothetical protein